MADKTIRTRALEVALRAAGSERALSRRLHVPMADLSKWLRGDGEPTQTVFLRTVDFLIEHSSVDQLRDDRAGTMSHPKGASKDARRNKL